MTPLEKSRAGLYLLKEAIVDYLVQHPEGLTNIDITRGLELESDFEGGQKNYLSWSILGILLAEKVVRYEKHGKTRHYFVVTAEKMGD